MNNKVFIGIIVVVAVAAGGFFMFSQSDSNGSETASSSASKTTQSDMSLIPTDLATAIAKAIERQSEPNVYVIDVRTPQEWEAGHAKDAMQWGLAEKISRGNLPPIPKDSEVYIYCRTGVRAGQAIRIMQEAGYTNMTNIRGFSDWQVAGGSTEIGV